MIAREDVGKILEAGVRAPSGENSQPWRFEVRGNTVSIYNIPERDLSLYNFDQMGSMVAHGALIENMAIAATHFGYNSLIKLFPNVSDPNHTADITLKENEAIEKSDLYEHIPHRVSNRTAYKGDRLTNEQKTLLIKTSEGVEGGGKVIFVDEKEKKRKLGVALSYGDRLLFENTKIHDFLFSHIYWTLEDAKEHRSGFYVKELGLARPQEATFKLLKKHSTLKFFNKIGFPVIAAKGNAKLYSNSSAIGAVIMKENNAKDFINGGRVMERIWLTATKLGYSIQPVTAIIFFMQRVLGNGAEDFSERQIEGIKKSYAVLQKEFGVSEDTFVMLFRIGHGKPIAHRSFRLDPEVKYHPNVS